MIAQELEVSLHMAFVEARQQRHEFITVEHLLMALLDNPSAAEVLRACAANIDDLRKRSMNGTCACSSSLLTPWSCSLVSRNRWDNTCTKLHRSLTASTGSLRMRL